MSLFARLSNISRQRKLELFYRIMIPSERTKVLDAGAEINPDGNGCLQLIDSYPWKNNLSAVNLSSEHVCFIKRCYPQIDVRVGDVCQLPWPDKYFDIVYSNAVIEHLGHFEKQRKMADEVMRVGKRWFVTTPNRWYPFEFHLRLPLVTWLPGHFYLSIGKIISYNHVRKRYMTGLNHSGLRLMTTSELKRCFPESKIIKQRVTFMAETLIAVSDDIKRV
jgi:SAM-dependent methyltransferase